MGLRSHGLDSPGREILPFAEYGKDTGQSFKKLLSLPGRGVTGHE